MISDRFVEAFKSLVYRVLEETDRIDWRALYPARVAAVDGNTLDVEFEDARLSSKAGVPIVPPLPGMTLAFDPPPNPSLGTRVYVGWREGDPRYPYVSGISEGGRILDAVTHRVKTRFELDVPLLRVTGDVERRHDLGRGGPPVVVPLVGVATLLSGTDRLFAVQMVTVAPLPPGTPLFTATFATTYAPLTPLAVASGSGGGGCTTTPATVTVLAGGDAVVMSALVLSPGTRTVVVYTGAPV